VSRAVRYDALEPDMPSSLQDSEVGHYSLHALVATLVCGTVLIVACLLVGAIGRYLAEGMLINGWDE